MLTVPNINGEVRHIDTQFHVTRDEKDLSKCSQHDINKYCQVIDETCVEPAQTRNINGKDVYKDCWKWDRKYCRNQDLI